MTVIFLKNMFLDNFIIAQILQSVLTKTKMATMSLRDITLWDHCCICGSFLTKILCDT
jgi:hypothetical protein